MSPVRTPQQSRKRLRNCLLVGFLSCFVSACSPSRETVLAPGYSEAKFSLVHIGDESNRVVELIGQPFRADHQHFSEVWIYGSHPTVSSSASGVFVKEGTIPIPKLVLYFGPDGLVKSYYGDEGARLQGKDKNAIQAILGSPAETKTNADIFIFNYTEGKHSESFDVRAVIFNGEGRVVEKKSFYYRD